MRFSAFGKSFDTGAAVYAASVRGAQLSVLLTLSTIPLGGISVVAQESETEPAKSGPNRAQSESAAGNRHALIVVGLAGDESHRELFDRTVGSWKRWLIRHGSVAPENLIVLFEDRQNDEFQPTDAERITKVVSDLNDRLSSDDSLWVFLLGHGSFDRRHAWLHLPGPDLTSTEWADLFVNTPAGEQVFWLTHSASGKFIQAMSRPGRVVITATDADGEINETRFPHLLAEQMQRFDAPSSGTSPLQESGGEGDSEDQGDVEGEVDLGKQVDSDGAGDAPHEPLPATVLQLFVATAGSVREEFEGKELVLTEHAQLDDNADGSGTEAADLVLSGLAVDERPHFESGKTTSTGDAVEEDLETQTSSEATSGPPTAGSNPPLPVESLDGQIADSILLTPTRPITQDGEQP